MRAHGRQRKLAGIDLGTTYSAIAHFGRGGRPEIVPNGEGERTTPWPRGLSPGVQAGMLSGVRPGSRIADYLLLAELARGGMGSVFRASDGTGREVALKLLHAGREASLAQRARFRREALALARLRHPHLVAVHDTGEVGATPWIALELVEGESLEARLAREGPLSLPEAVSIVRKLAEALAHAHAQGVLHRDIKPANVLVRPGGEPVLVDFGLAYDLGASVSPTVTGQLLGTPGWWPPEQARGQLERIGPASDVYGLGALLVGLLTGEPPHGAPPSLAVALEAVGTLAPPPSVRRPEVDPRLDAICLRALRPDVDQRYPDVAALAAELSAWERAPRASRHGRRAALLVGLLALVAAGAVMVRHGALSPAPPTDSRAATPSSSSPAALVTAEAPRGEEAARVALAARDLTGALRALDLALAAGPPTVDLLTLRGELHLRQGDDRSALADLERALELDRRSLAALVGCGRARLGLGAQQMALEDFARALELEPDHAPALAGRGRARLRGPEHEAALADLERALELAPSLAEPWFQRGWARLRTQDASGALADYDRGLELDPLDAQRFVERGQVRRSIRGSQDDAAVLADFTRAIELAPDYAKPYFYRAIVHADGQDYTRALADFDRVCELSPEDGEAFSSRGAIRDRVGDGEGALADFSRSLELDPHNGQAFLNRGVIRNRRGDLGGALEDWRRAEQWLPANWPVGRAQVRQWIEAMEGGSERPR